jgi:hypothetical protein
MAFAGRPSKVISAESQHRSLEILQLIDLSLQPFGGPRGCLRQRCVTSAGSLSGAIAYPHRLQALAYERLDPMHLRADRARRKPRNLADGSSFRLWPFALGRRSAQAECRQAEGRGRSRSRNRRRGNPALLPPFKFATARPMPG